MTLPPNAATAIDDAHFLPPSVRERLLKAGVLTLQQLGEVDGSVLRYLLGPDAEAHRASSARYLADLAEYRKLAQG